MNGTAEQLQETMFLAGYHNLSIIPINENKTPTISWKKYQSQRPDILEMSQWLNNAKGLGLVTGKISGILVLDIDMKNGKNGFKSIKGKDLPITTTAKTKNNGIHYYFKLPKNNTYQSKANIFNGVDIRCEGGFVVMPGTKGYEWDIPFTSVEDLAEIPEWLINELQEHQTKKVKKSTSEKPPKPVKTTNKKPSKSSINYRKYYQNENDVTKIMEFIGINASIGQAFHCILPSDKEDNNPSASIIQGENGEYVYKDWREQQEESYYTLPEVYASLHYREKKHLNKAEHATWSLKLLVDMKILKVQEIQAKPLNKKLHSKPNVRAVYEGFINLLQVKKLYNETQENTAFSYRFASAWSDLGVSHVTIMHAMKQLESFGYIENAGKENGLNTYKLTSYC